MTDAKTLDKFIKTARTTQTLDIAALTSLLKDFPDDSLKHWGAMFTSMRVYDEAERTALPNWTSLEREGNFKRISEGNLFKPKSYIETGVYTYNREEYIEYILGNIISEINESVQADKVRATIPQSKTINFLILFFSIVLVILGVVFNIIWLKYSGVGLAVLFYVALKIQYKKS